MAKNPLFGTKSAAASSNNSGGNVLQKLLDAKRAEASPLAKALESSESVIIEQNSSPDTPHEVAIYKETKKSFADEFNFDGQPDKYDAEQVAKLAASLELIQDNLNDKDMIGQAVKNILSDLKQYPELTAILRPEHCGLMVKGLKQSYGTVIAKKSERKSKKQASSEEVNKILENMGGIDLSSV